MSLAAAASSASAVYPLNETSGNAIASVGGQDLTQSGTIGTGTCFGGAARDFEESTGVDKFTHADNAVFQSGDIDFTICAWIRMESKTQAYPAIVAKTDSGGTPEYHLIYRGGGTDTFEFLFGSGTVRTTDFGSPSTGIDYVLVAVHRATANELAIYCNGTKTQISYSSGNTATGKGFGVGDEGDYHDGDSGWDGLIREVVILKNYAFSDAEVTELYNGGVPVTYANWTPSGNTATVWLLRA